MKFPNIFLVGFMGSGKTHWGRIWAEKFRFSFVDLDYEIEKAFGMSIESIFEKHSEEKFRELEKYHLQKNENKKNLLVSCGGGTPCFLENMDWMLQNGIVIYLKASERYILERVMEETDKRPLLKKVNESELLFFIQKTLKEREPVYKRAHYILRAENLKAESLKKILDELPGRQKQETPQKQPVKPVLKH